MFEVYVLVCIINMTDCTELVDTKGPYETQTECKHRAIEMRRDFDEVLIEGVRPSIVTNASGYLIRKFREKLNEKNYNTIFFPFVDELCHGNLTGTYVPSL